MDKILEVKNLKISFRTSSGTLKAVRDISFDLERGKTLAIVGESGSGKSVTSKAILGILAGNSIIEGGEILYDGKDLLSISEDDMYKIRGDKISMIFQDPLSSLNPIVKIGNQITEAMLLKNKANRREAREEFNRILALLKTHMTAASGGENAEKIAEMIEIFDKFCIESTKLETEYNEAVSNAEELIAKITEFVFMMEKKQKLDVKSTMKDFSARLLKVKNHFLTVNRNETLGRLAADILAAGAEYKKTEAGAGLPLNIGNVLSETKTMLDELLKADRPNFFRIGYYKLCGNDISLGGRTIADLNEAALLYLDENFMKAFIATETKGVIRSYNEALEKKKALLPKLEEAKNFYRGQFTSSEAEKFSKTLADAVEDSIDKLELNKDSIAYTFRSSLDAAIAKYFRYKKSNPKEEARFERQTKKREALVAKGKVVDWKVVPKVIYDLDELKDNIVNIITRLQTRYVDYIAASSELDFDKRALDIINHLNEKASQVVYRVTKSMAKEQAIKLMEEVGIHEPRARYYQYPFEFSGGMRQRIVIAIALAANPDILICDEPTTALDVTIQAQILELINKLKAERNLSVIFITHDLGVVANMADDIAVMYAGKIVEYGTADDIFYDPRHPYTWALLSSMPDLDTNEKLDAIPGTPPNMIYPPEGDAFADRNKYALKIDFEEQPPMFKISPTHKAATWLLHPNAPKVEVPKIITDRIARMKSAGGEG